MVALAIMGDAAHRPRHGYRRRRSSRACVGAVGASYYKDCGR